MILIQVTGRLLAAVLGAWEGAYTGFLGVVGGAALPGGDPGVLGALRLGVGGRRAASSAGLRPSPSASVRKRVRPARTARWPTLRKNTLAGGRNVERGDGWTRAMRGGLHDRGARDRGR